MKTLPPQLLAAIEEAWNAEVNDPNDQQQLQLLQKQLDKAKALLKVKSQRTIQLESLLKHSTDEFETEVNNAKQHIAGLEMALADKQQELEALRCELAESQVKQGEIESDNEKLKSYQAEWQSMQEQHNGMAIELDKRGTLLASLQIETRRLSDNLQHSKNENEALIRGNAMLQSRNNQLTDKFDQVSNELASSKKELQDKEKHIEILMRQLRLSEQNVRHLEVVNSNKS